MNRIVTTDFDRIRANARSHLREYEADYWQTIVQAISAALRGRTARRGLPVRQGQASQRLG